MANFRKLKLSTGGNYFWQKSPQLGQPPMLLGHAVHTCCDTGSPESLFGSWQGFVLLQQALPHTPLHVALTCEKKQVRFEVQNARS